MKELITKIDDANFTELTSQGLVLVDFYADWCGPCRMLSPILEALSNEMGDKLRIAKLDVDHASKTTASFQITSVPTMILFKNGKEVERIVGLKDLETLKKLVQHHS
jgi:thioredoxin 1